MKIYLLPIMALILLSSCSDTENEKKETVPEKVPVAETGLLDGCYQMVISGDTAVMNLKQNGDNLTGSLIYKRKDKDSNTGNVVLTKTGGRAEGYYTFQSEGHASVRQIVFKIIGNSLAEGYGNIEIKNDTAVLKYPHALNFEEKHAFAKVNCR